MLSAPKHRFYSVIDQELVGRDVFVVALFTQGRYAAAAPGVEQALDRWLALVPETALEWAKVGASATHFKPYAPALLKRARAELSSKAASSRDLGAFELCGGENQFNPSHAFKFLGNATSPRPGETCYVELRFPSEFPGEIGFDRFAEFVRGLGEVLPYRAGYASPALSRGWENMKHVEEGASHIVPLAFRHPGYDLFENDGTSSFMPGDKCRGARWLSLLGPLLVEQLGGPDALRAKLDPAISVEACGAGLMLRAGKEPEIGDVNRAQLTPLLRSVASALEPVTYFEDWKSLGGLFKNDREQVLRWERRHLD